MPSVTVSAHDWLEGHHAYSSEAVEESDRLCGNCAEVGRDEGLPACFLKVLHDLRYTILVRALLFLASYFSSRIVVF